jgi:hypothetical protein
LEGDQVLVTIHIKPTMALAAIKMEVCAEWITEAQITKSESLDQWDLFKTVDEDTLRILLVDSNLSSQLEVEGPVLTLSTGRNDLGRASDRRLRLLAAEFGTNTHPPVLVVPLVIEPEIAIPVGSLSVDVGILTQGEPVTFEATLTSSFSASGLQFDFRLQPDVRGTFGEIVTNLPNGIEVFSHTVWDSLLRVVISDIDGRIRIPAGQSAIQIPFQPSRVSLVGDLLVEIVSPLAAGSDVSEASLLGGLVRTRIERRSNTPPAVSGSLRDTTQEGEAWSWELPLIDLEGDPVLLSLVEGPPWISEYEGTLSGVPHGDDIGEWVVKLNLTDSSSTTVLDVGGSGDQSNAFTGPR